MRRFIERIMIIIFSLMIIFHLLILASVIPSEIVWGSRLNSPEEVVVFELISLLLNALFLVVMLIDAGFVKMRTSDKLIKGIIWGMVVLFMLNTVGNLLSENDFEKLVFTPLTLILSIGLSFLAMSKSKNQLHNT